MEKRFKEWSKPVFDEDGWAYKNNLMVVDKRSFGWRCQHSYKLCLGKNVDVGCFSYMNAKFGITIEDDVQIGSHCSIYSENTENDTHGHVFIGKGSLIGSHSLILPNACISRFTKIRAYSIIRGEKEQ